MTTHALIRLGSCAALAATCAAQSAVVATPNGLPAGFFVNEVSRDGSRAAGTPQFLGAPYLWSASAAGLVPLGSLPPGVDGIIPSALDADGDVFVGWAEGPGLYRAARWTAGVGFELLPDPQGATHTILPADISADGQVIVGTVLGSFPDATGYRWTAAGGWVSIGDLPGGITRAEVYACSADGSVIVGSSASSNSQNEAFVWTSGGGMIGLGDLPGGAWSAYATDVSADGATVVGDSHTAIGWQSFRWTAATGMVALGDLPGGEVWTFTRAVSGDGSIIVGQGAVDGGGSEPFLWTEALGMVSLHDYVTGLGAANIGAWEFLGVGGISDDGNIIHGVGNYGGLMATYRLDLSDPNIGVTVCAPGVANSTGLPGRLTALGSAGAGANDLTLFVSSLPAAAQCLLLVAPAIASVPQPGGSQGVLCLGGPIGRYAPQTFATSALGSGALSVDLAALPGPTGFRSAMPGETWTFQAWHRDANPNVTSNFTHAVSVTVQ